MNNFVQVLETYTVAYPNPIRLGLGDSVQIEKREPPGSEWAGWVFCVDQRGVKGWVSETCLRVDGDSAVVVRDYDATELAASEGESLKLIDQEFGWAWVENARGQRGWVPLKNLIPGARSACLDLSVEYLGSEEAQRSLEMDAYWPKWNSPWWHMLLLHEMGETKRIPETAIRTYIKKLNKMPLQIFPIYPGEHVEGVDPYRGCPCHCQLGNVYQVLAAWGVEVDQELPWIRPWLLRYQMADGGLNCDNEAYLVQGETPSSMVGTIAAFEAILLYTPRTWSEEEKKFLEKGAEFLRGRQLRHGSQTKYNGNEQKSAQSWLNLCFPRFYFYDVLRGLNALLIWCEKTNRNIPFADVCDVIRHLESRFADGTVLNERLSYAGTKTLTPPDSGEGEWTYGETASLFPLLEEVSAVGARSPVLTRQWAAAKKRIERLKLMDTKA